MVKSPSCVTDPFQARLDKRRTTEITRTAEPLLRDVIELKQAARWHGGKIRIDQACEAAAEGMVRQPTALRISFRSEETRSLSGTHQEHTKSPQTSHPPSCASSSSTVELPQMSGGTFKEQSSTDASDSSLCGSNCASRLEEPVVSVERSHEERVTFRWRRFLLLTYLVVTALLLLSCGARWSRKTGQDDIQVKMGPITEQPQLTPPLSRMCLDDATTTDDKQNGDVLRMQPVPPVQKSGIHISYYGITCFTVCAFVFDSSAYGGAGDGAGLRLSLIGRELQNVECSSRISRITTGTTIPTGTATSFFRLVASWVRKHDGRSFECFQTNNGRSM